MSAEAKTLVNFVKFANGNEFKTTNAAGILPHLKATEQMLQSSGFSKYRYRSCNFNAHLIDETRFLPTMGLVTSCLVVDEISGREEEAYQLLNKLIAAAERYNAALIFVPLTRSYDDVAKAKPDRLLLKIAGELFHERLKRSTVESKMNRSVPFFIHRANDLPLYQQFDDVVEACDETE
jgi:hypothetical protein